MDIRFIMAVLVIFGICFGLMSVFILWVCSDTIAKIITIIAIVCFLIFWRGMMSDIKIPNEFKENFTGEINNIDKNE